MRRRISSGSDARRLTTGAAFAFALLAGSGAASAADVRLAAASPLDAPTCTDDGILSSIRYRFSYGAAQVENRNLALDRIDRIRETWTSVNRPSPVPRRWCAADVTLSDGTRSTLHYVIAGGTGFAAPGLAYIPDAVEFCVAGHDPWRVHDGTCRTTRKFW